MNNKKGFANIIILIIVVAAIAGIGGYFFLNRQALSPEPKPTPNPIEKPIPTPVPVVKPEDKKVDNISYIKVESNNPVVVANNKFTFDIYSKLTEKGKNVFLSPLSISSAFAMVYEGALGKTADEIQSVFHFPKDKNILRTSFASINNNINQSSNYYKLSIANALWAQKDFPFLNSYFSTIDQYYGGKVTNLDFINKTEEARQTINKWVEDKTNNKIQEILSKGVLTDATRLVLTNAIYFKGQWEKSFDKKLTTEQNFKVNTNTNVKVQMMQRTDKDSVFKYGETENLQMLEMPYTGNKISMLVLLPKDNDILSLEKSLSVEKMNEWENVLDEKRVDVFLPKFKFDTKYSLVKTLDEMGMPTSFTDDADFSGMDGKKDLSISDVIHQAFVDVNEEGTEAAAATVVVVGLTSVGPGRPSIPVFRADHPFLFVIQDVTNGNILFIGKVENPTL